MSQKKYASLSNLQNFLDKLKTIFAPLSHKHSVSDITDYKIDTELSSTSNNPVANSVLDAEFEAMAKATMALDLAISGKSDISHNHDDRYYTESEVDNLIINHNHDSKYDTKGSANSALESSKTYTDTALETAKSYTDTKTTGLASTTYVDTSIENIPAITTTEIDEICGAYIYAASEVEV